MVSHPHSAHQHSHCCFTGTAFSSCSCGLLRTVCHVGFEKTCLSENLTGNCVIQHGSELVWSSYVGSLYQTIVIVACRETSSGSLPLCPLFNSMGKEPVFWASAVMCSGCLACLCFWKPRVAHSCSCTIVAVRGLNITSK